ncbi:MAG TPA: hypothetical protein VJ672_12315 [Gemmatimonadaceae bacterium]|nr:hypothetical protein [Gemmatimonadaceae bacterium]
MTSAEHVQANVYDPVSRRLVSYSGTRLKLGSRMLRPNFIAIIAHRIGWPLTR